MPSTRGSNELSGVVPAELALSEHVGRSLGINEVSRALVKCRTLAALLSRRQRRFAPTVAARVSTALLAYGVVPAGLQRTKTEIALLTWQGMPSLERSPRMADHGARSSRKPLDELPEPTARIPARCASVRRCRGH